MVESVQISTLCFGSMNYLKMKPLPNLSSFRNIYAYASIPSSIVYAIIFFTAQLCKPQPFFFTTKTVCYLRKSKLSSFQYLHPVFCFIFPDEQPSSTATGIGSSSSHTQTTPVNNHVAGTTNVSKQSVNVVNNLNQNTTTTVSTSRIVGGEQGGHGNNGSALAEGPQWSCSECTFLNHPALDQCEQCEWFRTGGSSRSSSDKSSTGSDSSSSSRVSYSSSSNPSNRRHPFPSSQPRASCFCHPNTPTPSSPPPAGGGGDRVGGGRPPPPLSSTNTSGSSTNSSILAHLWEMTSATSDGSSTAAQPPSRLQTPR